ncbi:MFS transporter [Gulosibacter molinativorax]|uniref:MFS transporter n=1 Tax=Gulosibacter molinativorax TaxID=256821 RepID=A0ABT7CA89_9MICO|nr:MFS transporter [Gulosibacter molinativorax]MDJ1372113.1 MFS transporter [Gulosibacter molinativorax]QUY62342.1 ABC transporter, permease protein [Gulosibacter molinativorax]
MSQVFAVIRKPNVARLLFSQLLARFPAGMLAVGLLVHVQQTQGNYTSAGAVIAAYGIGQGISGPLGGRLMSRFGMRGVLIPTMLVCSLALIGIALLRMPLAPTAALAFVAGLTVPAIPPAVRTIYPKVAKGRDLQALFTFDATVQEIIWILGPLSIVAISAFWDTTAGILIAAIVLFIGSLWFVTAPEVGSTRIPPARRAMGTVLRNPVLLIMAIVSLLVIGSWGALDAAIVAQYGHDSPYTAFLLGFSALGSLLGGVFTSHLPMRKRSLSMRSIAAVIGAGSALLWVDNPWLLGVSVFIAGASCAPIIAVANAAVSASVRQSESAEAFGWLGTAQLVGSSIASALAGIAIDRLGATAGMSVGATFVVLATVVAIVTIRWQPDLRGASLEPRPDTVTIPVVRMGMSTDAQTSTDTEPRGDADCKTNSEE